MKKLGLFTFVLSFIMPVMANAEIGTTYQCWDFEEETTPYGILPSIDQNPYAGDPIAIINDLSGQGLSWDNGVWYGEEFKIILDIPNQPIANPYKLLTINMKYQGELSFLWVADIDTGKLFTPVGDPSLQNENGWNLFSQQWLFEPNPREELVVIGLKTAPGTFAPLVAGIDQICIETSCIPEPATLSLLALGAGCILRRKKS